MSGFFTGCFKGPIMQNFANNENFKHYIQDGLSFNDEHIQKLIKDPRFSNVQKVIKEIQDLETQKLDIKTEEDVANFNASASQIFLKLHEELIKILRKKDESKIKKTQQDKLQELKKQQKVLTDGIDKYQNLKFLLGIFELKPEEINDQNKRKTLEEKFDVLITQVNKCSTKKTDTKQIRICEPSQVKEYLEWLNTNKDKIIKFYEHFYEIKFLEDEIKKPQVANPVDDNEKAMFLLFNHACKKRFFIQNITQSLFEKIQRGETVKNKSLLELEKEFEIPAIDISGALVAEGGQTSPVYFTEDKVIKFGSVFGGDTKDEQRTKLDYEESDLFQDSGREVFAHLLDLLIGPETKVVPETNFTKDSEGKVGVIETKLVPIVQDLTKSEPAQKTEVMQNVTTPQSQGIIIKSAILNFLTANQDFGLLNTILTKNGLFSIDFGATLPKNAGFNNKKQFFATMCHWIPILTEEQANAIEQIDLSKVLKLSSGFGDFGQGNFEVSKYVLMRLKVLKEYVKILREEGRIVKELNEETYQILSQTVPAEYPVSLQSVASTISFKCDVARTKATPDLVNKALKKLEGYYDEAVNTESSEYLKKHGVDLENTSLPVFHEIPSIEVEEKVETIKKNNTEEENTSSLEINQPPTDITSTHPIQIPPPEENEPQTPLKPEEKLTIQEEELTIQELENILINQEFTQNDLRNIKYLIENLEKQEQDQLNPEQKQILENFDNELSVVLKQKKENKEQKILNLITKYCKKYSETRSIFVRIFYKIKDYIVEKFSSEDSNKKNKEKTIKEIIYTLAKTPAEVQLNDSEIKKINFVETLNKSKIIKQKSPTPGI
ncbi:MAG: hypothetical protein LBJ09_01820 [Clostridiales bacterium]|jgi:hypothetical protein|nr:hypothetical protein [Clostridiales bacterium]